MQNTKPVNVSNAIKIASFSRKTLSALLDTQRAAIVRGDNMSELSCSLLKVRLKRSLTHGNLFATRPLFEPVKTDHFTNTFPRVLQLNDDLYLTASVLFLENYRPNRILRFKIGCSFYLFINYTSYSWYGSRYHQTISFSFSNP